MKKSMHSQEVIRATMIWSSAKLIKTVSFKSDGVEKWVTLSEVR